MTKDTPKNHDDSKSRDAWLDELTEKARPYYAEDSVPLPTLIEANCGFPQRNLKGRVKGEAHEPEDSANGAVVILISPMLSEETIVATELFHQLTKAAWFNNKSRSLRDVALKVGWEGSAREMKPDARLQGFIDKCVKEMARPYPHETLMPSRLNAAAETPKVIGAPASQAGKGRSRRFICLGKSAGQWCDFGPVRAALASSAKLSCAEHNRAFITEWPQDTPDPRIEQQPPIAEAAE